MKEKRTHGGAVSRHERMTDKFQYQQSKEENPEKKESIARKAAELIEPHDVVFIGEGTTASLTLSYVDPPRCSSHFFLIIIALRLKLAHDNGG